MIRPDDAIYRLLLRAFPAPYRRRLGDAMLAQMPAQRRALHGRPRRSGQSLPLADCRRRFMLETRSRRAFAHATTS